MTFDGFEQSVESSQPIEIYRFILGGDSFAYTTSEDTITIDTIDYIPVPGMNRSSLATGPDDRDNDLSIDVPATNEFARLYLSIVPGQRAKLTLQRVQRPDFPSPEVITIFTGFVKSVAFTDQGLNAKITVRPITSAASRPIPRFTYQSLCNHVLYDSGCKVDENDSMFRFEGTISVVSGNDITVVGATSFVDGFFNSGFAEVQSESDIRMILDHVDDVLTLNLPFPFDAVGKSVLLLAGCDHEISTCDTKFFTSEDATSNVINYGGFAFVPTKDVFTDGID